MNRPLLDEDIHPVSEFRANATSFVQQVRRTHRPVVITHRGKSAAVLLSVSDYETLLGKLELVEDVRAAEEQIEQGRGIPHATAQRRVMARLKK